MCKEAGCSNNLPSIGGLNIRTGLGGHLHNSSSFPRCQLSMVNQKSCCWNPRFWPPQFNFARSQKDPQFPLTIKLKSRFAQGSSNPRTEPESNSSSLVRSRSPPEFKKELATNRLRGLRWFKKHVQFGFHGCLQRYRCESEPHGSRLRLQPAAEFYRFGSLNPRMHLAEECNTAGRLHGQLAKQRAVKGISEPARSE